MQNKHRIEEKLKVFLEAKHEESRLINIINTIEKCKITGWEKWLQIELAHFLNNSFINENGYNWSREYGYTPTGEKAEKSLIYPDFAISFDNEKTLYLIEIKVNHDKSALEKGMTEDLKKYENTKKLKWNKQSFPIKGVFFLGILTNSNKDSIKLIDCHIKGKIPETNSSYFLCYKAS